MKLNKKKYIIIIGSSGFIGRNIYELFCKNNYNNDFVIIPVFFNKSLGFPNEISFSDFISNCSYITDYIIIAAGNSQVFNLNDFGYFILKDTDYLKKIFKKLKSYSKKTNKIKIIFISSTAVYYGASGLVYEEHNTPPNNYYGLSKFISEKILISFCEIFNINYIIFRLSYAFGKYEKNHRLFPSIAFHIKNNLEMKVNINPEAYLNPLPVEFISEIIYKTILNWNFKESLVLNLSSINNIKISDILNYFEANYGLKYFYDNYNLFSIDFYSSCIKLDNFLKKIKVIFPDIWKIIDNYVKELIKNI
jgi:UDP-glucose 4-epimerase